MGFRYFDQYSLIHASSGIVLYFWSVPFLFSFLLHALFEFIENTKIGMNIINSYFTHNGYIGWPGGKPESDSIQNIVGDNVSFIIGWLFAAYLDKKGKEEHWYYAT